jgi:hypothetical protein
MRPFCIFSLLFVTLFAVGCSTPTIPVKTSRTSPTEIASTSKFNGTYKMHVELMAGSSTDCRNVPNAERVLVITDMSVTMGNPSSRVGPLKGTINRDGSIEASGPWPTGATLMFERVKYIDGDIIGQIRLSTGGCIYALTTRH